MWLHKRNWDGVHTDKQYCRTRWPYITAKYQYTNTKLSNLTRIGVTNYDADKSYIKGIIIGLTKKLKVTVIQALTKLKKCPF